MFGFNVASFEVRFGPVLLNIVVHGEHLQFLPGTATKSRLFIPFFAHGSSLLLKERAPILGPHASQPLCSPVHVPRETGASQAPPERDTVYGRLEGWGRDGTGGAWSWEV